MLPDCTVRAFSLAMSRSYRSICKILGVPCISGKGLNRKNGAATIEKMLQKFKNDIEKYEFDREYQKFYFMSDAQQRRKLKNGYDPENGTKLKDLQKKLEPGRYVVIVRPRKEGAEEWHATFVDLKKGILFDAEDYLKNDVVVFAWIKIKASSVLKAADADSRVTELKKIYNKGEDWGEFVPSIYTKKEFEKWKEMQKTEQGGKERTEERGAELYKFLKYSQEDS